MGKIFPFDRQAAASRVRAESKRAARERQRTEEAAIWAELANEQIASIRDKRSMKSAKVYREKRTLGQQVDRVAQLVAMIEKEETRTLALLENIHDPCAPVKDRALTLAHCHHVGFDSTPTRDSFFGYWMTRVDVCQQLLQAKRRCREKAKEEFAKASVELRGQAVASTHALHRCQRPIVQMVQAYPKRRAQINKRVMSALDQLSSRLREENN